MPNWKLSTGYKQTIEMTCRGYTQRAVDYMRLGFPLTAAELQTALTPPDALERLLWLKEHGYSGLPTTSQVTFVLAPAALVGLPRAVVVRVLPRPDPIFATNGSYGGFYSGNRTFTRSANKSQTIVIPPEKEVPLAEWATKLLKEMRLKETVDATVAKILAGCATTAHVMARWPFLATAAEDKFLRGRLGVAPKNLKPYVADATPGMVKRMQASEIILVRGQMLAEIKPNEERLDASIGAWDRFDTDPVWD